MTAQREWFEKDYYATLGVEKTATAKEVTKAYRKLARELHPDKNPGDAVAEERFKEVAAAYDVLGDEAKRKEYDEVRAMGPMAGMGGRGAPGSGGFTFNVDDMGGGLGDLFGSMFGRGPQGRGRSTSGVGPRRGADVTAQLTVDFKDAVNGITTTLYLTTDAACATCSGSGAKPGTSPVPCSACGGRGVVDDNQGMFSFSSPCRVCGGQGVRIESPCLTCHGTGTEKRQREVRTRIPAGVKDGQTIRLKGRGGPGRNGGPAGDLLVELKVTPHPLFGRSGDHLTVSVPVTFAEAALGGEIDVPTLDGQRVTLRLKPGTQTGSRHRVRGKGIATTSGSGDLIVTVNVQVPTELTDEQRAAVEQLAAATTVNPRSSLS
ncbi:MAG TPA: molecular chaperone DnaJ [Ilumatobacteraceae bacterium]|nr:molecular chaperone DnaJ [Ilumatobacteraceae bacterium]